MKDFFDSWFSIIGSLASIISLIVLGIAAFRKYRNNKRLKYSNPFNNSSQIRKKEIRRIIRTIMGGQSSAIISVFEQERTAILAVLNKEYDDKAGKLIFSDLDIASLDANCEPEEFWKQALKPLKVDCQKRQRFSWWNSALGKVYKACQNNQFDNFYLKELFKQLKQDNRQLVLMIDRFDLLLQRKLLKRTDFFSILREIASRYPSSLNLVITLSMPLRQFHKKNEELNPGGSPYFNFIDANQETLGVLSEAEIDKLLEQSERKLTKDAHQFIKNAAGGHPYLLQVATGVWWNAYDDNENNPIERAEEIFPKKIKSLLNNILQAWAENTCKAFLSVAQKRDVSDFIEELDELEEQGFIMKENGVWQIRPSVFSSLLVAENEKIV